MNTDSSDPTRKPPKGRDFEPEVAERLRPLAQVPDPDIWSRVAADVSPRVDVVDPSNADDPTPLLPPAAADDASTPTSTRNRWTAPLLVAAAIATLVAAGVALIPRGGQTIETPTEAVESDRNDNDDKDERGDLDPNPDQTSTTAQPTPDPTFPDAVDIGPDRTAMSSIPFGSFAVSFEAGSIIVTPDGEVLGHYPGDLPDFLAAENDAGAQTQAGPGQCLPDPMLTSIVLCVGEQGPTVEAVIEGSDDTVTIAAFPPPPDDVPGDARVFGRFTKILPAPSLARPAPALLQMSAECELRIAMMVDAAFGSETQPNGGIVRHLDGTGYWDDTWPAGESLALGWSADGGEAYVWRFNGLCDDPLDEPGVYAYQLDGSSRMLFPTDDEVIDITLISTLVAVN